MKRVSLYSSSRAKPAVKVQAEISPQKKKEKFQLRGWLRRYRLPLLAAVPGVAALAFLGVRALFVPAPAQYTQEDIDAAVVRSLETVQIPSISPPSGPS